MTVGYEDKVWRELRRLFLNQLEEVKVGVFKSGMADNGRISLVELAIVHEYGTRDGHVPARSFIQSTIQNNFAEYTQLMTQIAKDIFQRKYNLTQGMKKIGRWGVDKIKLQIADNIPPQLAESTVRQKGHAHALIDTGTLFHAIEAQIPK